MNAERTRPHTVWTARVHFMTGRRWEGPFLAVVEATTPSAAAARAVSKTRPRLKRRARIQELTLVLQRQPALPRHSSDEE